MLFGAVVLVCGMLGFVVGYICMELISYYSYYVWWDVLNGLFTVVECTCKLADNGCIRKISGCCHLRRTSDWGFRAAEDLKVEIEC
jgi:hypothetical protein